MKKIIFVVFMLSFLMVIMFPSAFASAEEQEVLPETRKITVEYLDSLSDTTGITKSIRYTINLAAYFSNVEDFENSLEYWDREKEVKETLKEIATLYENIGYAPIVDSASVTVVLSSFSNYTSLYIANGRTGYDKSTSTAVKTSSFFYNKYTSVYKTPFYSENVNSLMQNAISELKKFNGDSADGIEYLYVYITKYRPSHIQIQSNVDSIYVNDTATRSYSYTFQMTEDNLDTEITLIQTVPNTTGWYLILIISITVISAIVAALMILKRRRLLNTQGESKHD
ncbi:MAG: hypothetical protein LBE09_03235 [Christensenellaceae bacterium]|jgi:hypothetical protein|nr:hypothetical protein [Christensenellaceae bacterium]